MYEDWGYHAKSIVKSAPPKINRNLEAPYHTWASVKESKEYPPQKNFQLRFPPSRRVLFGKIFPPLENFRPILPPESEDSPPKIGQIFGFFGFPP